MNELNYEKAYSRLEKIVEELESDKLTLEESLVKYEEGLSLYKYCEDFLNKIEGKIEVLSKEKDKEEEYAVIDFLEKDTNNDK